MGINVMVNDPFKYNDTGYSSINFSELNDLLEQSDILTIHIPLTRTGEHPTFNMIDYHRIKKLKKGCLFINTSRNNIVDEMVLLDRKEEINFVTDV
jgi:erythronate-4-phosphate dehydrogenase